MKLSKTGLDLITSFEGYLKKQPDGSCKAYFCPAGVPTCGFGCTEGVTINTHWTREEADKKFATELAKFERAVDRLVTVELNQNQFDALVSFAYNCGEGALQKSTILKKLNKGDFAGACAGFAAWNKATVNGKRIVLRGLTRRRAAEAALFATRAPQETDDEDIPADGVMPQGVAPPAPEVSKTTMFTIGAAGATAIPAAPSLESFTGWKSFGETAQSLLTWATASPFLVGAVAVTIGSIWFGPVLLSKFRGTAS